jgi:hypothetical protein
MWVEAPQAAGIELRLDAMSQRMNACDFDEDIGLIRLAAFMFGARIQQNYQIHRPALRSEPPCHLERNIAAEGPTGQLEWTIERCGMKVLNVSSRHRLDTSTRLNAPGRLESEHGLIRTEQSHQLAITNQAASGRRNQQQRRLGAMWLKSHQ